MKSLIAIAACATAAHAQITYTSQTRVVSAYASNGLGDSDSDTREATDFSDFIGSASASASSIDGTASGYAAQNSSLQLDSILATGSASGDGSGPMQSVAASASCYFDVTFTLDQNSNFTLDLMTDIMDYTFTGESLDIRGAAQASNFTLSESGLLEAGDYHFQMVVPGDIFAGSNAFTFAFTVTPVPAPAAAIPLLATPFLGRRRR